MTPTCTVSLAITAAAAAAVVVDDEVDDDEVDDDEVVDDDVDDIVAQWACPVCCSECRCAR